MVLPRRFTTGVEDLRELTDSDTMPARQDELFDQGRSVCRHHMRTLVLPKESGFVTTQAIVHEMDGRARPYDLALKTRPK